MLARNLGNFESNLCQALVGARTPLLEVCMCMCVCVGGTPITYYINQSDIKMALFKYSLGAALSLHNCSAFAMSLSQSIDISLLDFNLQYYHCKAYFIQRFH